MRVLFCLIALAVVLTGPTCAAPSEFEPYKYHAPLRIELARPLPGKLVPGVWLPLQLVVTNITGKEGSNQAPVAIVLRGVEWTGYRPDARTWLRHTFGDFRAQPDGSLLLDRMSQRLSDVAFESALLFPGERVAIDMPFTIQRGGRQKVDLTYGVVGGVERWTGDVWLPEGALPAGSTERYLRWVYATPDRIAVRQGVGGPAVVRRSSRPASGPLELSHQTWSVEMAVAGNAVATGGLTASEALKRIGWGAWAGKAQRGVRGAWWFWRPVLSSWIFVRDDGTASALRRDRGGWVHEKLPKMDATAPDWFGSVEGGTDMFLRPDIFGHILPVRTPVQAAYYDPGVTRVPPHLLWDVLRRARERALDLRIATYDANGLGNEQAVAVGIRIDHRGHWMTPGTEKRY